MKYRADSSYIMTEIPIRSAVPFDKQLSLSYAEIQVQDPSTVDLAVGSRGFDLFLDPDFFPLSIGENNIDLVMKYGTDSEEMTVQLLGPVVVSDAKHVVSESSMDVINLTDDQKMVAFLYLLGDIIRDK